MMPRKQDVIQKKHYRAVDYPDGWAQTVEVEMSRLEKFQNGHDETEKLVVYFKRQKPGLVVGSVVWDQFAEVTGTDESNDWKGHLVELYRDKTPFQGKLVPCIRVRKPGAPPKKPSKKPSATSSKLDLSDEIPH
jgi:hypothetical protein